MDQIFHWYTEYEDVENHVKVAEYKDLKENDFNLNIPLYVEKIIEDDLPSVEEALSELKETWNNYQKAEAKFKEIVQNFVESLSN